MKEVINISSNGIKQAIDDLVNENEILRDKVYKLEEELQQKENIIKEVREIVKWAYKEDKYQGGIYTIEQILDKGD